MPVRVGWTRRSVLRAGGATAAGAITAIATGCSWGADPPVPPPPDPLEPLLAGARGLTARYRAVIAGHPPLADLLRPLEQAHQAHVRELATLIDGRPPTGSPAPVPTPLPAAPADPAEAIAGLRTAEQAAREAAEAACLSAPPERAALLGSITAARATHLAVLEREEAG